MAELEATAADGDGGDGGGKGGKKDVGSREAAAAGKVGDDLFIRLLTYLCVRLLGG